MTDKKRPVIPLLWVDTETTGVDPKKHGVIQISGIVEFHEIFEEFDYKICPAKELEIDKDALDVHGITIEEIQTYPGEKNVLRHFQGSLGRYVNKYNRSDKFVLCGYNVGFDSDMLRALFERCGDMYYGSWFFWPVLDVKNMVALYMLETGQKFSNYKLATLCKFFGVEIKAHDAMSDIRATRELYYIIKKKLARKEVERDA